MKSLMLALKIMMIIMMMNVMNLANAGTHVPEDFVVCSGWHALCSASPDCQMNGEKASCDCARVNENHIVATNEIQDLMAKRLTLARCTNTHP